MKPHLNVIPLVQTVQSANSKSEITLSTEKALQGKCNLPLFHIKCVFKNTYNTQMRFQNQLRLRQITFKVIIIEYFVYFCITCTTDLSKQGRTFIHCVPVTPSWSKGPRQIFATLCDFAPSVLLLSTFSLYLLVLVTPLCAI